MKKKDTEDYTYPYEIALTYIRKIDYKNAILLLEKIKGYSNINDYYYALLGNAYDLSGNPEQAIKSYDEGLKKFPASGRLYLEKGIRAEPMYPSNYYRISQVYLNSKDILYGLMYGEIFLNLERTTSRSKEMSKALFNSYKSAVKFTNQDTTIDLCQAVLIIEKNSKPDNLPFCIVFSRHFAVATASEKEINLETLSSIRRRLLKEYFNNNYSPSNVLLSYHKKMESNNLFNAYNHYIFQMGDQEAFNKWQTNNKPEYDKFVNWYTEEANLLKINKSNLYLSDQIK